MADEKISDEQRAVLNQAVTQLDMLILVFSNAPDTVKLAANEFRQALKDWADNG